MVLKPELCSKEIMSQIYFGTERPDEHYLQWVCQILKRVQYPYNMPKNLTELRDGYFYSTILQFTYPELITAKDFEGVQSDQLLKKCMELCHKKLLAIWPDPKCVAGGLKEAIKSILRQLYKPIDPLLERVYMTQ